MNPKNRKYSIPYNGADPQWYVDEVMRRKKHVDHVFCELPVSDIVSHIRFIFGNGRRSDAVADYVRSVYMDNCVEFLKLSRGLFRRICPVNAMYYPFSSSKERVEFALRIVRLVCAYGIDGLIVTDYSLALILRQLMPDLELHTSCNCYQWNLKQMQMWRDNVGIAMFNPPREILRFPERLKEMHDAGFRLKCIVNEGCLVGCPNTFNHQMSLSLGCSFDGGCFQNGCGDLLRGNWILPRWQRHYDRYVDVYKIAGRNSEGDYPFVCLDAFIREEDRMPLHRVMVSGTIAYGEVVMPDLVFDRLTLDMVPDRLMSCGCLECDRCTLCRNVVRKCIPKEYCDAIDGIKQNRLAIDGLESLRANGFVTAGV